MVILEKQTTETEDYDISFTNWLASKVDTGLSISVKVDPGITLLSSALSAGVVKLWFSGGSNNTHYKVEITLTTTGGRVREYETYVKVKDY